MVLEVSDEGDVGIWQRDQTQWIDVLPWTRSEAVRPGVEANRLAVYTRGAGMRFEVNGEVVADVVYDGIPSSGHVGVFVGGDLNQVALEWLRVESN
jgi:hypothetical protein